MDHNIRQQFNDEILQYFIACWGGDLTAVEFIQDTGNIVYRYVRAKDKRPFILRISHSKRRGRAQVQAELEWIAYLAQHGLKMSPGMTSENGRLVETHALDEGEFVAVLFAHAPGERVGPEGWNDSLFEKMGRLVGQMNHLSQGYEVANTAVKRQDWLVDDRFDELLTAMPAEDQAVRDKLDELLQYFYALPKTSQSYGLIHSDVHAGNFFLHEEEIHLFDFDDSCYHWYICDVANTLYYALWQIPRDQIEARAEFAQRFLRAFWRGYRQENALDSAWLAHVPHFMEYRDLLVYAFLCHRYGYEQASEPMRSLMLAIRQRLNEKRPYVDLNMGLE